MTTAERQQAIDAAQLAVNSAQAALDAATKALAEAKAIVPVDPMTPYLINSAGKKIADCAGTITLALDPKTHKTVGVSIAVDSMVALTLHLSRPGWNPDPQTIKPVNGKVLYPNNFSAATYTLVIGGQPVPFTFTVVAAPQPAPAPAPAPTPAPTAPATSGPDPRKDYPIAFPYSPLAQDAQGNTIIPRSNDARIFYVSAAGSDSDSGTIDKSLKTLGKALSLIRNGYPDQILLRRGDDFSSAPIQWKASGRSPSEPLLLGAYGTGARPIIGQIYTVAGQNVSNVAIVGLHIYAKDRDWTAKGFNLANVKDGQYGFEWGANGSGNLFEDNQVSFWWYNLYLHGGQWTVRRNVIEYAWTKSGDKAQGMYISGGTLSKNGPAHTIEENIIYHNGWCPLISGQTLKPGNQPGVQTFSHGIYCAQECGPVLYRGNIVASNANNGINGRSGGVMDDNLFIDNSTAGYVGRNQCDTDKDKEVWMRRNVAVNCDHGNGFGLETPFWCAGCVEDNIVAHHGNCSDGYALWIDPSRTNVYITGDAVEFPTTSLISVARNIFYGAGFIKVWAGSNMTIHAAGNFCNDPAGVQYQAGSPPKPDLAKGAGWTDTMSFVDPSRDALKYDASLGGPGTIDDLIAKAKAGQVNALAANAWIRAGFTAK